jgi:hypothetical protein
MAISVHILIMRQPILSMLRNRLLSLGDAVPVDSRNEVADYLSIPLSQ